MLTDGTKGMNGPSQGDEIVASDPGRYVLLQQFNTGQPCDSRTDDRPEIWNDTKGAVDIFVSGVGTGGTITGVSRYLKNVKGRRMFRLP